MKIQLMDMHVYIVHIQNVIYYNYSMALRAYIFKPGLQIVYDPVWQIISPN